MRRALAPIALIAIAAVGAGLYLAANQGPSEAEVEAMAWELIAPKRIVHRCEAPTAEAFPRPTTTFARRKADRSAGPVTPPVNGGVTRRDHARAACRFTLPMS